MFTRRSIISGDIGPPPPIPDPAPSLGPIIPYKPREPTTFRQALYPKRSFSSVYSFQIRFEKTGSRTARQLVPINDTPARTPAFDLDQSPISSVDRTAPPCCRPRRSAHMTFEYRARAQSARR